MRQIDVMDVTFMGAEYQDELAPVPGGTCHRALLLAVLLLPSLLLIGVFSYYPAGASLIGGFYQWNGFSPPDLRGGVPSSGSTSSHPPSAWR